MKRYNNLYPLIIDKSNIEIAYKKSIKGKSDHFAVKRFNVKYDENINNIHQILKNKTFTTSKYKTKMIFEPKKREIYVLPFNPDRIVHHSLMNILEPLLDKMFIHDSYSCRKNKGLHVGSLKAMQLTCKYKYCLKADISKFYPSISHDILYNMFENKIKCKETLWLLDDIIYSIEGGKNAPIGYYTSQWFGNLYMHELDKIVKHKYKVKNYIRYCDDFVLFDNDKKLLHELKDNITNFLDDKLQLKLSKSDIFQTKQGLDFLGYRYFPDGYILLRKSTSKRMKKKIIELRYLVENDIIDSNTALSIVSSIKGWLRWSNSYNLSKSMKIDELDNLIRNKIYNEKIFGLCI